MFRLSEFYDLRGDIARSAASEEEVFLEISVGGQPKINNNRL